jgi:4-amino-4-deoxy-L-arabinose transferase-like glycosyltransferase
MTPANHARSRWLFAAGLLAYCALLAGTLNNTRPYQGDESFYIASAIRMVRERQFLLPEYFGALRLQKPIVSYWLTALGYELLGVSLWSGRVFFLALSCALLILVYRFARLIGCARACARLAVWLLASSILFIESTRVSMTDMPHAFFAVLSLYFYFRDLTAANGSLRFRLAAFSAMGLAFAAKGFWGVMPFVALLSYLLVGRPDQWRVRLLRLFHPVCLIVFCLLAFSWYGYVVVTCPDELTRQMRYEAASNLTLSGATLLRNVLFFSKVAFTYSFPFTFIAAYVALTKREPVVRRLTPALYYVVISLLVLVFSVKHARERYLLFVWPILLLHIAALLHRYGLAQLARRLAVAMILIQGLVLYGYPKIVGQPIKCLVARGMQHAGGDLAYWGLSRREASWAQALSHGTIRGYNGRQSCVILEAQSLEHFESGKIVAQARILKRIRWQDGRLTKRYKTYVLIMVVRDFGARVPFDNAMRVRR